MAWAPTALAALALLRCGTTAGACDGFGKPLHQVLDPLPLDTLTAVGTQGLTLALVGCRGLGDVRHLPQGDLGRR